MALAELRGRRLCGCVPLGRCPAPMLPEGALFTAVRHARAVAETDGGLPVNATRHNRGDVCRECCASRARSVRAAVRVHVDRGGPAFSMQERPSPGRGAVEGAAGVVLLRAFRLRLQQRAVPPCTLLLHEDGAYELSRTGAAVGDRERPEGAGGVPSLRHFEAVLRTHLKMEGHDAVSARAVRPRPGALGEARAPRRGTLRRARDAIKVPHGEDDELCAVAVDLAAKLANAAAREELRGQVHVAPLDSLPSEVAL
mmetsp:Transcript_66756/g.206754  ORF Transcript_66756/g.206754 Transcript_66756/m.206754 type:complete len:255 (-) Transcript_66756:189-953(-)